jgi:hypothetical protein
VSGEFQNYSVLEHDAVQCGRLIPTFGRDYCLRLEVSEVGRKCSEPVRSGDSGF